MDVLCEDLDGCQYIIEMQVANSAGFEERAPYLPLRLSLARLTKGRTITSLKEGMEKGKRESAINLYKLEGLVANHPTSYSTSACQDQADPCSRGVSTGEVKWIAGGM